VNGQWVASTMTAVAITPRSITPLIQSHLGTGRCAAGEECSTSTWKYRQFECRRRVNTPFPAAGHVAAINFLANPLYSSETGKNRRGREEPDECLPRRAPPLHGVIASASFRCGRTLDRPLYLEPKNYSELSRKKLHRQLGEGERGRLCGIMAHSEPVSTIRRPEPPFWFLDWLKLPAPIDVIPRSDNQIAPGLKTSALEHAQC
jgi:hypothetical protein